MEEIMVVDQNILELMNIVQNAKQDQSEFELIQM
jgi:hypothetical protein